ncbi:hypothetical protein GR160_16095 [Flavobacterium sp. Sd200]|uniref:hypothetical protein n=1 Tax=Flavobacterium sp. Sd200 TaxID=2692211 RepID=UPI001371851D|nr:hypothetical protein [Flavobacterium sp. Sd200]MXN92751.1 hypothetical protein [Flavobacterium sp. Sd200]
MKINYTIILLLLFSNIFGQTRDSLWFDIYTIHFLETATTINPVPNENVLIHKKGKETVYSHIINSKQAGFLHNSAIEYKMASVLDSLNKQKIPNKDIAFFSFYDNSRFALAGAYFYLIDKGTFISIDNKKIVGIDKLIDFEYGSAAKYTEVLNDRKYLLANYKMSDNEARAFLQKDYELYQKLYPNLYDKAIALLIDDIDAKVRLNESEKGMIVEKVNGLLKANRKFVCNTQYAVAVNGIDVSEALGKILDKERLIVYLKHNYLNKTLKTNIQSKFYREFKKTKRSKNVTFDDYLRTIVSK